MTSKGLRWAVNIKKWNQCPQEWCQAMSCIQEEERKRINEFVYKNDATLSLVGRLLLRAGIVQLSDTATNESIVLGRTEKGRPYVIYPDNLHHDLNVSHQGDYAVLATTDEGRRVGVDVMQVTRPRGVGSLEQFFTTMNRQFTQHEWTHIRAPPTNKQKLAMFYRHWCLKESYIKAVGTGISYGLERIEFTLGDDPWGRDQGVCNDTCVAVDGKLLSKEWRFEESYLDEHHCVAVAIENKPHPLNEDVRCKDSQQFIEVSVLFLLGKLKSLNEPNEYHWILQNKRPTKD